MKKTILFCLASALLAVGLIGGAAAMLDSKKEAVLLEEELLYGDRAAAEGLQLDIRFDLPVEGKYDRTSNVWWELNQKYDNGLQFTPEFHFVHEPPDKTYYWEHQGLRLETLGDYEGAYNDQDWITNAFFESLEGELSDGGNEICTVDLSEHFEYLPLWFEFDYPHGVTDLTVNDQVTGSGYQLYRKLNELFPIPVPEKTIVEIECMRDAEDGMLKYACLRTYAYHENGNSVDVVLSSPSVCTEDGIYFTISPTANNGERLDLSALKLGYGIYFLPVVPYYPEDPEDELRQPDPDGLRRVIELDLHAIDEIIGLEWSEADDRLYVLSRTNGRAFLHCYDGSTYALVDTIELGAAFSEIRYEDGYLIACYTDNTFSVFVEEEGGYAEEFRHRSHFNEANLFNRPETYVDFDGSRLAVASADYDSNDHDYILAVYDAAGLRFRADYTTSLHNACYSEWYYLQGAPMSLHWGEGAPPQPREEYFYSTTTVIRG